MCEELVKELRELSKEFYLDDRDVYTEKKLKEAADAIEGLGTDIDSTMDIMESQTIYIEELKNQIPRWISVTERLPEGADDSGAICENVWLLFDDGGVYPGWMNGITQKAYYINGYDDIVRKAPISRVKMWQPRPQPPKEETK